MIHSEGTFHRNSFLFSFFFAQGLDYNDSEYELSGYSEVDTEPTKSNYSKDETVAGLKRHVFGDKSLHEIPRLQPSITQVPTVSKVEIRCVSSTIGGKIVMIPKLALQAFIRFFNNF